MASVELVNVSKVWGDVVAVSDINLRIEDGEFVAILGPSGCGKSTTLFMLAGIYAPTGGELKFDGFVINNVEAKDRNIGIVFQSYALYPHMDVLSNIKFPLKFKKTPNSEATERAREAAKLVHVEDLLDRKPAQMSGGQQQRVALARALVKEPQLLLLDEPLSNLDATLRLTMRTEIKRLQRKFELTTILVTHDQVEATTMADRVICMSKGKIEQIGTPEDLYLRPASLFVATFIGAPPINQTNGEAKGGKLQAGELTFPIVGKAEGKVALGLRPEHIEFSENGLSGTIEQIEPMGRETLYQISTKLGSLRVLDMNASARYSIGQNATVSFDGNDCLLFELDTERLIADTKIDFKGRTGS